MIQQSTMNTEQRNIHKDAIAKCIECFRTQIEQFPAKRDADTQTCADLQSGLKFNGLELQQCFLPLNSCVSDNKVPNFIFCDYANQCLHRDRCTCFIDCRKEICKKYDFESHTDYICCKDLLKDDKRVQVIASRLSEQRKKCGLSLRNVSERIGISHVALFKHEKETISGENTIEKKLCYCLAALYGTTPGYLMGQVNDDSSDLYVTKYTFSRKSSTKPPTKCNGPSLISIVHVSQLTLPIVFFSSERKAGMDAAQKVIDLVETEHSDLAKTGILEFISYGKSIYGEIFPDDIQRELVQFVNALIVRDPFEAAIGSLPKKAQTDAGQIDEVNNGDS